MYYFKCFQFPTVYPTAPTNPTILGNIKVRPIDVDFICRTYRGRMAYSGDINTVPVVPTLALVSYKSFPSIMVWLNRYLEAPQSIILLCCTFLEHPVVLGEH